MHRIAPLLVLALGLHAVPASAGDWLGWRGPTGNGIAAPDEKPVLAWSDATHVVWKTAVPGRGHSSPIAVGDLIVLTTADETAQIQSVIAFDRQSGEQRWRSDLHTGGFVTEIHRKNSQATPSPCSDGERIYAAFLNGGRIHLSALDLKGTKIWTRDTGPYLCRYGFGYAPSPVLAGDLVVVSSEFEKEGYLAAFDRVSGEERWRVPRNGTTSYSTPALARKVAGRDQIVISGNKRLESYDPATGRQNWAAEAVTLATCGTAVWEGDIVFASGGFPNKETAAVRADGSGTVLWRNDVKCYEQSMLVHEGHLYAIDDGGIAHCWDAKTGEEKWKTRLGGPVSASPILAGGHLYFTNERGITYVVKADPEQFQLVAENTLGNEAFASLIACGQRIFARVAVNQGNDRQEWLYCLGDTGSASAP